MVRVVRSNFENSFVALEAALKDAHFVAIDEEMTGIDLSDKQWRHSRADSAAVRYRKMAAVAERFSLIQFGVCPFVARDAGGGAPFPCDATAEGAPLVAHPFGVFVFPECDARHVTLSPSSIAFLRAHDMDFNAWLSQGVPYVDAAGEARLRRAHERDSGGGGGGGGGDNIIELASLRSADAEFVRSALASVAELSLIHI